MQMELRAYRRLTNDEKEKYPLIDLIEVDMNSIYNIEMDYKLEIYDKSTGNMIDIKDFSIGYSEHNLLNNDVVNKLKKL